MKILHHDDADGRASASLIAIMEQNRNKEDFIELNYSDEIPYERIAKNEKVFIVDYSFSKNEYYKLEKLFEITRNIVWIDHHQSSYDMIQQHLEIISPKYFQKLIICPSSKKQGVSAVALVYIQYYYSYPEVDFIVNADPIYDDKLSKLPNYIRMISDYDTWQHKDPDSIRLSFGLYGNEEAIDPTSCLWVQLFNQTLGTRENTLETLIEQGRVVQSYKAANDKDYINKYGYEVTIGQELGLDREYKCMAVNTRSNSTIFGDLIHKYDLVICYWSKERTNKFEHSLFTVKDDINCGKIAEAIAEHLGSTGGGHPGAAGFISEDKVI